MGAEHFKRALGSCNLKPAEGWAGGSSKKQMWPQQTHTVPDPQPLGACEGREEPEVRDSSAAVTASGQGSGGQGLRLGSSRSTWETGRKVLRQVVKGGIPTKRGGLTKG